MMYNKEHAMMNVHLVNVKMGVGRANNVNVRTIEASRGIVIQGPTQFVSIVLHKDPRLRVYLNIIYFY